MVPATLWAVEGLGGSAALTAGNISLVVTAVDVLRVPVLELEVVTLEWNSAAAVDVLDVGGDTSAGCKEGFNGTLAFGCINYQYESS